MIKEIHVAPFSVTGPFHIGRATEVISADIAARIKLQEGAPVGFVHDSWNTYLDETKGTFDPESEIERQKKVKAKLSPLLSSLLYPTPEGSVIPGSAIEFRDDSLDTEKRTLEGIEELKRKKIVIPGLIQNRPGLYFDIDAVLGSDPFQALLDASVFPESVKNMLVSSSNRENQSSYRGKIPITKVRRNGIKVPNSLLVSEHYHFDARFNNNKVEEGHVCVSPLAVLSLLPYIRHSETNGNLVTMMSVGKASVVRFVLVSMLFSIALEIPAFESIHTFGKIYEKQTNSHGDVATKHFSIDNESVLKDEEWGSKVRYLILENLAGDDHGVPSDKLHPSIDTFYMPSYGNFRNKYLFLKRYVNQHLNVGFFSDQETDELKRLGILKYLEQMNYGMAFKKLREGIYLRTKTIEQGVHPMDSALIKLTMIFFPDFEV